MSAAAARRPPSLQTFLAFDFGLKRTGVAVGNTLLRTARRRMRTIAAEGDARFAADRRAACANGSPTRWWSACPSIPTAPSTTIPAARARFARQLHGRFKLPVYEVDERYSTTEALAAGARDADAARRPASSWNSS